MTWALADHQGTVRDMIRYASGTTTVVNHRKYDAFGTVTSESDATVKFLYSYTGREWDGDAGLYYYRARWYDAKIGRFILEDPIGFAAGDSNLSRYVGNSAVNGMDPSGLIAIPLSSDSSGGDNAVPLIPFNQIGNGFPTTHPPTGRVTVIVAQRNAHTFLILLNENGQTRYFRGGATADVYKTLVVEMGVYGEKPEPYIPTETVYNSIGDVDTSELIRLDELMKAINDRNATYGVTADNCNTTSCAALHVPGLNVPDSPVPNPPRSTPGWGEPLQ